MTEPAPDLPPTTFPPPMPEPGETHADVMARLDEETRDGDSS